jgi:2-polyprenyl-3-methyl-5-hydroxy-6-metoxy-1,4-benzoquinol methylase
VTSALVQRVRRHPASGYVHPKALAAPADSGEHAAKLDVADENSPNYLAWIVDLMRPYLGHDVLEVGAGIGSITRLYAEGRRVVATDVSAECVAAMRDRFVDAPNISVRQLDLREGVDHAELFDSIVMINVLEHIEDDAATLALLTRRLKPGGNLIVYVPALNGLYGPWDRKVGHFRRYSKWRLRAIAAEAGTELAELRYVNVLAIPAWAAFSRTDVVKNQARSLSLWDRTGVPLSRAIEQRIRPPVGLNLLAVVRNPN